MVTLALEHLAKEAPEISFVHNFPGAVRSNIARQNTVVNVVARTVFGIIGPLVYMSNEECGERHLFMATSARYPARNAIGAGVATSVRLLEGVEIAEGTDAVKGSGVYLPDAQNESAGPKVVALLQDMGRKGLENELWKHTEGEFMRICGSEADLWFMGVTFVMVVGSISLPIQK